MPIYEEKEKMNGQKRWYIRTYIIDENGRKKQITKHNKFWLGIDGKREAQRIENLLLNKPYITNNVYFENIYDKFNEEKKEQLKESSFISYREVIKNQIMPFFKGKKIIDSSLFLNWHTHLENKNLSVSYMNKCHTILSNILAIGVKYSMIPSNYEKEIGPFKENKNSIDTTKEKIRYITYEQFNNFIKQCDSKLWYTVFNLLFYTGMRKGELLALTWEDIQEDKIIINKTYTDRTDDGSYKITSTKNYKKREITINNTCQKIINEWKSICKPKSKKELIFNNNGQPISTTSMTRYKNKYFEKANIKPITIHEFRHSHVSLLINQYIKSGQTDTVKFFLMMSNRMGHTIQVMQETYMHLFPDTQNEIVDLLNNLDKKSDI